MRKFIYLLVLLLCTPVYAQQSLEQIRINDFSKGMNSFDAPDVLGQGFSASNVNVVLNKFGKLTQRKGQDIFNLDVGNTAFRGLGRFDPDKTTSYIVTASGTDVIASLSNDTSWRVTNYASQLTSGQDTEFVQANDLLFTLNGFNETSWWDGSTFAEGSGYPASPPSATTGAWLRNYLFLAGATSNTDWLYFSNNLEPTVYTASDIIKINTGDGQSVQKLLPYRLNELIIYKQRSIFVLDITGSTPLDDWTVQPISKVVGTPAPRSVVSLGNDQWFLSSEPIAIRSLVRTEFDKILVDIASRPVQDIFEGTNENGINLNTTHMSKSAAVLYNNKYMIAIPTGTSTVNNTVLVHDFMTQAWYIIKGWFPASWIEFDNRLFYMDANDGRVVECFVDTGGDVGDIAEFTYGSDASAFIEFVYQSSVIDYEKPEVFKRLDSMEVELNPTGNYTATTWINLDNNGWASVGTINLAGNSLTLPVTLPTQLQNAGFARKTFQLQQYGEFKKMQVMINNYASQESVDLRRISIFSDPKTWRRE